MTDSLLCTVRFNHGLSDHQKKVMRKGLPERRRLRYKVILVGSGKGGVGKSTTAGKYSAGKKFN